MDYLENIQAQIRKGILEFAILLIIAKKEVYAQEILKKLRETQLLVVEGTLYPLLSRLKRHELVECVWKESRTGPPRKYYKLTEKGRAALTQLNTSWEELSRSITSLTHTHEKGN
ncbi:PadR family transcriptional regulator [Candidatus Peregrinibacteria bacterium CG_4_9_14_0_2_um_filter_53_11]|nr:MAG: PadR family transcriptional regulator [Candidatus Peregrinibacteria bacterium CG_4_9_14_0_2_um_filter_53_11]